MRAHTAKNKIPRSADGDRPFFKKGKDKSYFFSTVQRKDNEKREGNLNSLHDNITEGYAESLTSQQLRIEIQEMEFFLKDEGFMPNPEESIDLVDKNVASSNLGVFKKILALRSISQEITGFSLDNLEEEKGGILPHIKHIASLPSSKFPTVKNSVGEGGENMVRDVRIIQSMMFTTGKLDEETVVKEYAPLLFMSPDEVVAAEDLGSTIAAIHAYQKSFGWKKTDGKITAGSKGGTLKRLSRAVENEIDSAVHEALVDQLKEGSNVEQHLKNYFDIAWIDHIDEGGRPEAAHLKTQIDGAYSQYETGKSTNKIFKASKKAFVRELDKKLRKEILSEAERSKKLRAKIDQKIPEVEASAKEQAVNRKISKHYLVKDSLYLDILKKQVTPVLGRIISRIDFMGSMTHVLGSPEAVKSHFTNIKKANVPGIVFMREPAARSLEKARDVFKERFKGYDFPKSWVAQDLRTRHQHGGKASGHPLGLSIDYLPKNNPFLTNSNLRLLLNTIGQGPTNTVLKNQKGNEYSFSSRRKVISKIEKGTAGKEGEQLLAQVSTAYSAMAATSNRVKDILSSEEISELKKLGKNYYEWRRARFPIEKARANLERKQVRASAEIRRKYQKQIEIAWLDARDKLRQRKEKTGEGFTNQDVNQDNNVQALIKERDNIPQEKIEAHQDVIEAKEKLNTLEKRQEEISKKLKERMPVLLMKITKLIDQEVKKRTSKKKELLKELKESKDQSDALSKKIKSIDSEIEKYNAIKDKVLNDYEYIFGIGPFWEKSNYEIYINPPLLQILIYGFAREDAMPERTEEEIASNKGELRPVFNGELIKVMIEHGFDTGAAWDSADTMHFDYLPEFGKIKRGLSGPKSYLPK